MGGVGGGGALFGVMVVVGLNQRRGQADDTGTTTTTTSSNQSPYREREPVHAEVVKVRAEPRHVGGDDGVEQGGHHARGEDLAEDLLFWILGFWVWGVCVVGE